MPAGNGTGPMGMGPMTGRAAAPGCMNGPGMGGGAWGGRGAGRGRRNRFFATGLPGWQRAAGAAPARDEQLALLKAQAGQVEDTLSGLRQRIEALEAGQTE